MKAIVTGGAGFIGSHLVDTLLSEDIHVTVLDNFSTGRTQNLDHVRNRIELIECDLSIKSDWNSCFKDIDWVFHLAALADIVPSIENPTAYFQSNVDATFNVLQASVAAKIKRFIYAASSSCYGIANIYPTPENAENSFTISLCINKIFRGRIGSALGQGLRFTNSFSSFF